MAHAQLIIYQLKKLYFAKSLCCVFKEIHNEKQHLKNMVKFYWVNLFNVFPLQRCAEQTWFASEENKVG